MRGKSCGWNPWHGCKKISAGCANCYVYRMDDSFGVESSEVKKTGTFNLPVKRKRDKSYKIESGTEVYTCFTSDFFIEQADEWRKEAWEYIRIRKDLNFIIFTKRIDRFMVSLPDDWNNGYDNVVIGCTVENQDRADYRLPIFNSLPIKHKLIICAPLISKIDLEKYLNKDITEVSAGGESGCRARVCDFEWVKDLREQCVRNNIKFTFHQTGAKLMKDGRLYRIKREFQHSQAKKAGVDYLK